MAAMHANGFAVRLAEVERLSHAVEQHARGPADVLRDPERAREVVAAAGRHDPERGGVAQRPGELADEPVPAQRDHHLAAPGCLACRVGGVGHVARLDDAVLGARRVELALQAGQHAQRLSPRGRGVHQDRETAVGTHGRRAR